MSEGKFSGAEELLGKINFREVVENLVDGVYITDGNGITLFVNPAFCRHTDIRPEELIGKSVMDIEREGVLFRHSVAADVIKAKRCVTGAGFIRTVNGRKVNGYASGVPIFGADGNVSLVIVSVVDAEKLRNRFNEFKDSVREEDAIQILENYSDESVDPMIGAHHSVRSIRRTILRAAPTDVTVLITGESGVGKEVVADRIYSFSSRVGKPYIKVNCAALPSNLLEHELFGYEKGAGDAAKAGLFELANGGTILLDEIGDLPHETQTKLLRVIQNKEVFRRGAAGAVPLDVRVIAVTNANLRQKIQSGSFREDLYYRLSVVPISVPPLRERRCDIEKLVKYYFNEYCKKHGRSLMLAEPVLDVMINYDWPGNVRELQNVLEYMVIRSDEDAPDEKLLCELLGVKDKKSVSGRSSLNDAVEAYERELVEAALRETGGIRRAANYLKVDPSTVSRKARKYNISIPLIG